MKALWLLAAHLSCVLGWARLALAMESHWQQVRGKQRLPASMAALLRAMGTLALLGGLLLCLRAGHVSMALLVWVLTLTAAGLTIAFALAWQARLLAPLVAWLRPDASDCAAAHHPITVAMNCLLRLLTSALAGMFLGACGYAPPASPPSPPLQPLLTAMRSRPVVLLGEVHDNAAQHALRAQALRLLLEGGARPALLMEQFDRERQTDIARVGARPGATADEVIAAGAPAAGVMSGWDWALYRPYVALALEYRLTLVAANVSRVDTRRVVQDGLAALGFDAAVPPDIELPQAQAIVASHCGLLGEPQALRMVGAQVARDQFMALQVEAHAAQGVVLLAGNGHVRSDIGVPRWLAAATHARSVAIGVLEPGDPNAAAFDVTVTTAAQPRPDPCAAMRASPPKG